MERTVNTFKIPSTHLLGPLRRLSLTRRRMRRVRESLWRVSRRCLEGILKVFRGSIEGGRSRGGDGGPSSGGSLWQWGPAGIKPTLG